MPPHAPGAPVAVMTLRRSLFLVALILAITVALTQFWSSRDAQRLSIDSFNAEIAGSVAAVARDRLIADYRQVIDPVADLWARYEGLTETTASGDPQRVALTANSFYQEAPIVQETIRAVAINVYDGELNFLGRAARGGEVSLLDDADLLARLRDRPVADQRRPVAFLWVTDSGRPVHTLLAPIGGFRRIGFLELVTDPLFVLDGLDSAFNADISIYSQAGDLLLELHPEETVAETGPDGAEIDDAGAPPPPTAAERAARYMERVETTILDSHGQAWATLVLDRDIADFVAATDAVRDRSLMMLGGVGLVALLLGGLLLRFAVLRKLGQMSDAMERISKGDTGVAVPAAGNDEIGAMAKSLDRLRGSVAEVFSLRQMLEASPTPTTLVDLNGLLLYANAAAHQSAATLGLRDLERGTDGDLFGLGDRFHGPLHHTDSLPARDIEAQIGDAHVTLSLEPVRQTDGRVETVMLTWRDVSEELADRRLAEEMLAEVSSTANLVLDEANALVSLAERLARQSESTLTQATGVETAAVTGRDSATHVAEHSSQLTASIQEIAEQSTRSADAGRLAVEALARAERTVSDLGQAATAIEHTIAMIVAVAEQTRLLALNATIEAARAGEAGKGFAVVASEVRNLAGQTGNATTEIHEVVGQIRNSLNDTVTVFTELKQVVESVSTGQTVVSTAVEQQNAMSADISRNVEEIAAGSRQIVDLIAAVTAEARETGTISSELRQASSKLGSEARNLTSRLAAMRERAA